MSDYDLFGDFEPEQPATLEEDKPVSRPPKDKKPKKRKKPSSGGGFYNFLAFLFLAATIGVIALVILLVNNPWVAFNPFQPPIPQPSVTLFPSPASGGPDSTPTRIPTALSSAATRTPTLPPSSTGLTLVPTGPNPLTTYPFTVQNEAVTYTRYSGGCNGLYLVGQVFNLQGEPLVCGQLGASLPCRPVAVKGENFSTIVFTGSAQQWGPSGYEVYLNSRPIEAEFKVQLLETTGAALSEVITVKTLASCEQNMAVVNFIQIRDFEP